MRAAARKSTVKASTLKGSTSTSSTKTNSRKRKPAANAEDNPDARDAAHKIDPVPLAEAQVGTKRSRTSRATAATAASATKNKDVSKKGVKRAKLDGGAAGSQPPGPSILGEAPTQVMNVIVFGTGDCGELGLGSKDKEAPRPRLNPYLDPSDPKAFHVVQLDCGGMHVAALTRDNQILTWGVNDQGALGRPTEWEGTFHDIDAADSDDDSDDLNPLESTPTPIPADTFPSGTRFVQVATGDSCTLVLTETGSVYGWGTFLNPDGKPGFGLGHDGLVIPVQRTPRLIPGLQSIVQITCGANHALALDSKGNIWAWGAGEKNQLGRRLLGRRAQQSLVPHIVEVCPKRARYIASGQYHSFAIDNRDNVWAWGQNRFGEAGYAKDAGTDTVLLPYPMKIQELCSKGVTVVDGGSHHSAAVTRDGQCFVWGRIDGGQLGIQFTDEQLRDESLVRRDERDKPRICLRPVAVPGIGEAAYVSCGIHTIFVAQDGRIFGAGFADMGQLGIAAPDDVTVATQITGKALKERPVTWAGTGGQFSVVAGPAPAVAGS